MAAATTFGVRGAWLQDTIRDLQILIGQLSCGPSAERATIVERIASCLPAPESPVERLLVRGLLVETGLRLLIRESFPARPDLAAAAALVSTLETGRVEAPSARSAAPTGVAFSPARTEDAGLRVQHFIEANLSHHVTLRDVAQGTGLPVRRVNSSLRAAVGLSVRQFVAHRRLGKIVEALTTSDVKVEAIALEVGYRSKKDLYRLVRRFTGFTPSRLRAIAHRRSGGQSDS
jgi:AraC-like DNA-binding protein